MKKIIIILLIVCIVGIGVLGYLYLTQQSEISGAQAAPAQTQAPLPSPTPVFMTLQPVTVSIPTVKNGYEVNKILYVGVVLRVADEFQKATLTQYLPEVRSSLLLLLANQSIDALEDESGKLQLKELIKQELSRRYSPTESVRIDDVLFTDFIIR